MTRVLSYNILVGGTHRVEQLIRIIKSSKPDVVGLIEAIDEEAVKKLAEHLGMQYCLSGRARDGEGWQGAVLSHLPIFETKIHISTILTKQPLLEVCVEEAPGQLLTVFVTHLTADFGKGLKANKARRREVQELLRIMQSCRGTKHVLIGDFNSVAPGERLKGSSFLRYVSEPELYYQLKPDASIQAPNLDFVVPPALHIVKPLLALIPRSKIFSALLDSADVFYAPRGGIDLLNRAGYVDCFRVLHSNKQGFTWPAPIPSGRVDFIFASTELASQLQCADVIVDGEGLSASQASDHLPIFADFCIPVAEQSQKDIKSGVHSLDDACEEGFEPLSTSHL